MDPLLDPNVDPDSLLRELPAEDNTSSGTLPPHNVSMLELEHRQGHYNAIPYAHVLGIHFDPSVGIKVQFATHTLRIRGRNLKPIYRQLVAHTCTVLRDVDAGEDTGDPDVTLISDLIFRRIRRRAQ